MKSKFKNLIFGIGTDIIEVERIASELIKNNGLKEELFTAQEIRYCESKKFPEQHFAGKYAAKEAFFKATGTGWGNGYAFNQVEIFSDGKNQPEILVKGKSKELITKNKINKIHVSISHVKDIASAYVILERISNKNDY